MIIACPSCHGPFEIPNGQIAPLVQVDCPNCGVRNIFDFAAANDPSLIEEAHGRAAGFMSADAYRQFKSSGAKFDFAEPKVTAAATRRPKNSVPTSWPPLRNAGTKMAAPMQAANSASHCCWMQPKSPPQVGRLATAQLST